MARPLQSAADTLAMRETLCAVALALYREEGEAGLSLRRIAEAAGCSHTLPYRYFVSKDALLAAMRARATRDFEAFVRAREKPNPRPADALRDLAAAYVAFAHTHPADYQLLITPGLAQSPDLQDARESLFGHAQGLVQRAIEAGVLDGDSATVAHVFWGGLHGLLQLDMQSQLMAGCTLDGLLPTLIERLLGVSAGQRAETT